MALPCKSKNCTDSYKMGSHLLVREKRSHFKGTAQNINDIKGHGKEIFSKFKKQIFQAQKKNEQFR